MPVLEKLAFLGAVTLASVLIAQELDKTIAALDRPSEVIDLEEIPRPSPAPDIPPTLMSLAPSPTGFLDTLTACKGMAPSIGANVDQDLVVTDYKRFVLAEAIYGLPPPQSAADACLPSSAPETVAFTKAWTSTAWIRCPYLPPPMAKFAGSDTNAIMAT